jgi:hypothetical protein
MHGGGGRGDARASCASPLGTPLPAENKSLQKRLGALVNYFLSYLPWFLIRDILVRIRMRIRILGSQPLTNGSGSVPKSSVTIRMAQLFHVVMNEI